MLYVYMPTLPLDIQYPAARAKVVSTLDSRTTYLSPRTDLLEGLDGNDVPKGVLATIPSLEGLEQILWWEETEATGLRKRG